MERNRVACAKLEWRLKNLAYDYHRHDQFDEYEVAIHYFSHGQSDHRLFRLPIISAFFSLKIKVMNLIPIKVSVQHIFASKPCIIKNISSFSTGSIEWCQVIFLISNALLVRIEVNLKTLISFLFNSVSFFIPHAYRLGVSSYELSQVINKTSLNRSKQQEISGTTKPN